MKEELKKTYRGFLGWIRYIRDYKDNVDNDLISEQRLIDANRKINKLEKEINEITDLSNKVSELSKMREKRIQENNARIGLLRKALRESAKEKAEMQKFINELANDLEEKEYQRRNNATKIGHKQRKINSLQKQIDLLKEELNKKEDTITFLKTNRHAPTIEEIKAYEYSRKAVEKRIKNGRQ